MSTDAELVHIAKLNIESRRKLVTEELLASELAYLRIAYLRTRNSMSDTSLHIGKYSSE